jgi:hypothetical protein
MNEPIDLDTVRKRRADDEWWKHCTMVMAEQKHTIAEIEAVVGPLTLRQRCLVEFSLECFVERIMPT